MKTEAMYEDGTYLSNNPTWHEEDSPWKATQISRMIDRNAIKPASICEVGCGAGEILNRLADILGDKVKFSGYEISPQAFEICRKKVRPNLHFHLKDMLDEEEASFDLVMAIDLFEHCEDYIGFIRRLRQKGKYKIFHIPLDLSVQSVLRCSPILHRRTTVGHLHYFTKEIALAALKDAGYEVMDYFYTNTCLDLPSGSWKAKLMKMPRRLCFAVNQDLTARILGGFSLLVLAK